MINIFAWGTSNKSEMVRVEGDNQVLRTVFGIVRPATWVHKVSFYICFGNYEQKCVFHYSRYF